MLIRSLIWCFKIALILPRSLRWAITAQMYLIEYRNYQTYPSSSSQCSLVSCLIVMSSPKPQGKWPFIQVMHANSIAASTLYLKLGFLFPFIEEKILMTFHPSAEEFKNLSHDTEVNAMGGIILPFFQIKSYKKVIVRVPCNQIDTGRLTDSPQNSQGQNESISWAKHISSMS